MIKIKYLIEIEPKTFLYHYDSIKHIAYYSKKNLAKRFGHNKAKSMYRRLKVDFPNAKLIQEV